jgi:hypothetical protein
MRCQDFVRVEMDGASEGVQVAADENTAGNARKVIALDRFQDPERNLRPVANPKQRQTGIQPRASKSFPN